MVASSKRSSAAPTSLEWQRFLGRTLTVLAASSLLAAAVCFIAYNWENMGTFFKLGLLEALALSLALLSWHLGCGEWPGRLAIFCAVFLVGPLLAVYGQAYPSGAPISKLLYAWAGISALAALLVGTEGLWLLALAVLNAAFFYWSPFINGDGFFLFFGESTRYVVMGLTDIALFALSLALPRWLPSYASRYLLVFAGVFFLSIAFVLDTPARSPAIRGAGFYILPVAVTALAFYGFKGRDLFSSVVAMLGMFAIGNTLFLRWFHSERTGLLLLTFLNLIAGGAAAYGLNSLHRKWKNRA